MEMNCPHCFGPVQEGAHICKFCGRVLRDYVQCPQCDEVISQKAVVCSHCRYDFRVAEQREKDEGEYREFVENLDVTISASPIGALIGESSITALFIPPQLTIKGENILVKKWTVLGLRCFDQKLTKEKIASVRSLDGIIWADILIETFGGATSDLVMKGLDKEDAIKTVQILERLVSFK